MYYAAAASDDDVISGANSVDDMGRIFVERRVGVSEKGSGNGPTLLTQG